MEVTRSLLDLKNSITHGGSRGANGIEGLVPAGAWGFKSPSDTRKATRGLDRRRAGFCDEKSQVRLVGDGDPEA